MNRLEAEQNRIADHRAARSTPRSMMVRISGRLNSAG
jgi:hypothetical protein